MVPSYGNPTVLIAYRGNDSNTEIKKVMKAVLYDHNVIRKFKPADGNVIDTKVLITASEVDLYRRNMSEYMKSDVTFDLPRCDFDEEVDGRRIPGVVLKDNFAIEQGLLFIPGWEGNSASRSRSELDMCLIKTAYLQGRPILAVCAGCWDLIYYIRKATECEEIDIKVAVIDHANRRGMVTLNPSNGRVLRNEAIHEVKFVRESLIQKIVKHPIKTIQVNSVHRFALDQDSVNGTIMQVAARSIANSTCKNKNGEEKHIGSHVMDSQGNVVEAVESVQGVPIIGTQWHAEAYTEQEDNFNYTLIRYMISTSIAFDLKQAMQRELHRIASNFSTLPIPNIIMHKKILVHELKTHLEK